MKKRVFGGQMFWIAAVLIALALPARAIAGTYITGTAGNTWQTWDAGALNENGQPYWDGDSADGDKKGIGYYLTNTGAFSGSTAGPGAIPFWGSSTTATGYDANFYFNTTDTGQVAAMQIEIAGNANINVFGWYDIATGSKQVIFSGSASAGATTPFTPTAAYGFYLLAANGDTYYTQSGKNRNAAGGAVDNNRQHFAVFRDNSGYWLGIEDLRFSGSDKDYNDMIIKVTPIPTPVPAALWLFGAGLLGFLGCRWRGPFPEL